MKKLKQMSGPYSIGFELSSTAHGFVATDPNGNVLYHGKQPVMGTRVFKEGQHAAEARMPRTSRRGIQRRRGRDHEMERVFAPVISSIEPDFFIRRRMSYKLGKIRFESDPIGFSYSRLFHSFPTLAHLDVALMEADSAMDPRLIFEAVANHVVRRGHFLLENQNVSSTNSDIDTQVANYAEVLVSYFEDTLDERIELSLEALDINGNVTARELQKQFASAMCVSGDDIQKKTEKAQIKAIADLVAGYKADLTVLVPDAEKLPKVSISDGDALEEFLADSCPDSLVPVLMAAQALYTSWKLQGMLSYAPGKSLSHNQVAQHDVYGKQLRMLKDLALKYVAKQDAIPVSDVGNGPKDYRIMEVNSEYSSLNEKLIRFDVKFLVKNPVLSDKQNGKKIEVRLHVDLEGQKTYRPSNPTYPIETRAIYYVARELSAQIGIATGKTNYADLEN